MSEKSETRIQQVLRIIKSDYKYYLGIAVPTAFVAATLDQYTEISMLFPVIVFSVIAWQLLYRYYIRPLNEAKEKMRGWSDE